MRSVRSRQAIDAADPMLVPVVRGDLDCVSIRYLELDDDRRIIQPSN
jgi:hypothetical protein